MSQGSIPVAGARARRTLRSLALGHLTIAFASMPIALLLRAEIVDDRSTEDWLVNPVTAGLLLAIGQILSCGRNLALAHALTDRADVDRVARALRHSEWSVGLALCGIVFVLRFLLVAPVTPLLSALTLMMIIASLLLEHRYADWAHRCLSHPDDTGATAEYHLLPPRVGPRLHRRQPFAAVCHAIYAGIAAILLVATIATELRSPTGTLPTALVQIVAAAAATVVPLVHIRAVLLVRAAILGDTLHLPTLRRAGASFIRAGSATAPLTAIVVTSVLVAPAEPAVAVGRAALLVFVLGIGTLQFASISSIHAGDFPKRWLRAAGAR